MKITKQIEHFNLDHDVVIAVQNGTEVEILMRILKDGGELQIVDEEGDAYNGVITLADVHERVQHSPQERLIEMENEEDDAITADCILQTVLFEDVIFG